jgi:hypothetical protein
MVFEPQSPHLKKYGTCALDEYQSQTLQTKVLRNLYLAIFLLGQVDRRRAQLPIHLLPWYFRVILIVCLNPSISNCILDNLVSIAAVWGDAVPTAGIGAERGDCEQ